MVKMEGGDMKFSHYGSRVLIGFLNEGHSCSGGYFMPEAGMVSAL